MGRVAPPKAARREFARKASSQSGVSARRRVSDSDMAVLYGTNGWEERAFEGEKVQGGGGGERGEEKDEKEKDEKEKDEKEKDEKEKDEKEKDEKETDEKEMDEKEMDEKEMDEKEDAILAHDAVVGLGIVREVVPNRAPRSKLEDVLS
ncbi:hypothetical protein CGRA01v4_09398 [Colletotrichum graminicola]|nr:hypothetical protein CGRA01v4_09398 [Colletotrichum graminicola]